MNLKQIKFFLSVCKNKSFIKASYELNISQPAISKAISQLEYDLGVKLFDRVPKGVSLTEFGALFIKHAELITTDIRKAKDEIISKKEGRIGDIVIGAGPSAREILVPLACSRLINENRNIHIDVVAELSDDLSQDLDIGKIDMSISMLLKSNENQMENDYVYFPLYKDRVNLITKKDHYLQTKKTTQLSDTIKYNWILPKLKGNVFIDDIFIKHALAPPVSSITYNSAKFALNLIENSDFIGFLPTQLIKPHINSNIKQLNLKEIDVEVTYGITFLKEKPISMSAHLLVNHLKEISSQMIQDNLVQNA